MQSQMGQGNGGGGGGGGMAMPDPQVMAQMMQVLVISTVSGNESQSPPLSSQSPLYQQMMQQMMSNPQVLEQVT